MMPSYRDPQQVRKKPGNPPKYTDEQREEMRRMVDKGLGYAAAAERFGVSEPAVKCVVRKLRAKEGGLESYKPGALRPWPAVNFSPDNLEVRN